MFDRRTSAELFWIFHHPLLFGWRLMHAGNIDFDKEILGDRENRMVDGALSLPPPERNDYDTEIAWLKKHRWEQPVRFPYDYIRESNSSTKFGLDEESGLPFAEEDDRRIYFCKGMSLDAIRRTYTNLMETEGILGGGRLAKSPHSYVSKDFHPDVGDVIIDIGCSEGLFAAAYASTASKVYLFESEKKWMAPLLKTFSQYKDRTTIVPKFVGDKTTDKSIRLADSVGSAPGLKFFIKMDIEGGEVDVIRSSLDFLARNKIRLSCCTYHRQSDADIISKMLGDIGYTISFSDGYMLMTMNGVRYPYFRRGVLHAVNY